MANVSQHWRLKGRRAHISSSTSGPNTYYRIRIMWTPKLGIELKHTFDSHDAALAVVNKIEAKGVICVDHWTQRYYPKADWATTCSAD